LLQSHINVVGIAKAVGTAMLGGWVRGRLERREVEHQQAVLGTAGRQDALRYAHELQALPFAPSSAGWPVELTSPDSLVKLGISCMVALLIDPADGARERFTLRFAHGHITPLELTMRQRDEATSLIHNIEDSTTPEPGFAS
jgi:hypothetical protein